MLSKSNKNSITRLELGRHVKFLMNNFINFMTVDYSNDLRVLLNPAAIIKYKSTFDDNCFGICLFQTIEEHLNTSFNN